MLFNNDKKSVYGILAFIVIFIVAVAFSTCSHAAEIDIAYGRTVLRGPTDVLAVTVVAPRQAGDIDFYGGALLIGQYQYRKAEHWDQPNQVVWRAGMTAHIKRFGASLGGAVLQHDDALNSGKLDFNLGLDYRLGSHIRVSYNHISNAGTSSPNYGRDMVLVGWRF